MSSRRDAIEILQTARKMLEARLVARIVESGEEILDDAEGQCYGGPIEAVHDQLGIKLAQVNVLLGALSSAEPREVSGAASGGALARPVEPPQPVVASHCSAAPAAGESEPLASHGALKNPSCLQFVLEIQADSRLEAARTLMALFGLSPARAAACAERFRDRQSVDPALIGRVLGLTELARAESPAACELLVEGFGLGDDEAAAVVSRLRSLHAGG